MSNDFHVGPSDDDASMRSILCAARLAIWMRPLPSTTSDAFDHPREDRVEPRAIARQLVDPAPELPHGHVGRDGSGVDVLFEQGRKNERANEGGDDGKRGGDCGRQSPWWPG